MCSSQPKVWCFIAKGFQREKRVKACIIYLKNMEKAVSHIHPAFVYLFLFVLLYSLKYFLFSEEAFQQWTETRLTFIGSALSHVQCHASVMSVFVWSVVSLNCSSLKVSVQRIKTKFRRQYLKIIQFLYMQT